MHDMIKDILDDYADTNEDTQENEHTLQKIIKAHKRQTYLTSTATTPTNSVAGNTSMIDGALTLNSNRVKRKSTGHFLKAKQRLSEGSALTSSHRDQMSLMASSTDTTNGNNIWGNDTIEDLGLSKLTVL
jgi:hypothetical protein